MLWKLLKKHLKGKLWFMVLDFEVSDPKEKGKSFVGRVLSMIVA